MVVEFQTSRTDLTEIWEREIQMDQVGKANISQFHERDYLGKVSIDIRDIVDFEEGKVWLNEQKYECVYARIKKSGEDFTKNLIINYEDFKIIFETVHETKVESAEMLLWNLKEKSNV